MRLRLAAPQIAVIGAGVLLALAGCSAPPAAEASGGPTPPAVPTAAPAADAGGACALWDFGFLEEQLGVRFAAAAADRVATTSTCVVQVAGAQRPDLSLSVVEYTAADPALFARYVMPDGATTVKGLGRAAYLLAADAGRDHGPVLEVGWLAAGRQVLTLRFTFAVGATPADATAMSTRLVSLARTLDSAG